MLTEVALEFIIVVAAIILMFVFLSTSIVLLLGNDRLWRKSEATYNAGIVFLLLFIAMVVVAALMYMFYPQYFIKVVRSLFFL